jgi:putative transcriptional regulator
MMTEVADSIRRGLEQAVAYARGKAGADRYRVHIPPEVDVRAIRARLGRTRGEFAARFGFSVGALSQWEQGRRRPEGSTRIFAGHRPRPEAVQEALRAA